MVLELDSRQRAMLKEMGVQVWLPEAAATLASGPVPIPNLEQPTVRVEREAQPVRPEPASEPVPAAPRARQVPPQSVAGAPDVADLDWPALVDAVRNCQSCGLCASRSRASIAPLGDAEPCDWMVLSDPPDEDEDHAGAPFAGPDGVLLANMLRALGLQRANPLPGTKPSISAPAAKRAYLSHVLKCRPANGGVPKPAELAQCAAYLQREIALVQPKIILAMGRFANQLLLGETPALATLPLGKLRGTLHRYQGVPVVVTYHPKVLMRNGADKAKAWADLCLAASTLEA